MGPGLSRKVQWRSEGADPRAAVRRGSKNGGDNGASGITRIFGAAKLQSAPAADNPRYASWKMSRENISEVYQKSLFWLKKNNTDAK